MINIVYFLYGYRTISVTAVHRITLWYIPRPSCSDAACHEWDHGEFSVYIYHRSNKIYTGQDGMRTLLFVGLRLLSSFASIDLDTYRANGILNGDYSL